jgi:hypothetical protein
MTIPNFLEQLIHQGVAEAKVFTGGLTAQAEIYCPVKSYIVVYGYYYKPYNPDYGAVWNSSTAVYPEIDFRDVMTYVGFGYNGKFATFAHTIDIMPNTLDLLNTGYVNPGTGSLNPQKRIMNDIAVQSRSCYIVSNTNIGISISRMTDNTAIPGASIDPLPDSNNIFSNLGYAGLFIEPYVDRYITNAANAYYYPFTQQITDAISPGTFAANPGSSQLYTNPTIGGSLPALNIYAAGGGESAMGKIRMPVLNVLYVQVNQEAPSNLL